MFLTSSCRIKFFDDEEVESLYFCCRSIALELPTNNPTTTSVANLFYLALTGRQISWVMPEYVYTLNDYLENLDGEMSSHTEDQMGIVEKVDTAGNNAWWKVRPFSFT
jgi:hypothetical protein